MSIKIVTDSACDVPEALAQQLGITVVPVYINIGEEGYLDGVQLSRQEFYENLDSYPVFPTTAAPAPGSFAEVYQQLAAAGATEILSMHLASSLSNTYNAAQMGAEGAGVPVTLFDTQQITMGGGLLVLTAAEAVAAGHSMAEVVALLRERVPRTRVFGMLDTLDALRRSGRVSWAQFGLGTLLQIKPVMMIYQGEVSVVAKVRTRQRSMQQMLEMVDEYGPFERLAILHAHVPEAAEQLRQQATHLFPREQTPLIIEITPAIGVHLGVGAVGFACISAQD